MDPNRHMTRRRLLLPAWDELASKVAALHRVPTPWFSYTMSTAWASAIAFYFASYLWEPLAGPVGLTQVNEWLMFGVIFAGCVSNIAFEHARVRRRRRQLIERNFPVTFIVGRSTWRKYFDTSLASNDHLSSRLISMKNNKAFPAHWRRATCIRQFRQLTRRL